MSLKLGTSNIAGNLIQTVVTGFDLFDFKWSDKLCNDIQWTRADTFSWQSGGVYPSAYNHLVTDISGKTLQTETISDITISYYLADDGHKVCPASQEANLVSLYEATGIAWFYLLDNSSSTRFKLPRTKWGFNGLRTGAGNMIEQDVLLPNITGWAKTGSINFNSGSYSGALYNSSATGTRHPNSDSDNVCQINIDASRSSSVYSGDGTDTTIQPPATEMYLYFYVGEFARSALEQTAGITSEQLNAKVDKSSLTECHVVIDTYINGTSGYRIWDDGYCEQWGVVYSGSNSVTFLKTFKYTTYLPMVSGYDNNYAITYYTINHTTSSMTVSAKNISGTEYTACNKAWKASGYLADGEY